MKFFKKKKSADSRARRNAKVQWSRVRKIALYGIGAGAVVTLAVTVWRTNMIERTGVWMQGQFLERTAAAGFRVNDILVTGRAQVATADILQRLDIEKDMPIFGVNIADAQQSLRSLPWVEDVAVSRRLPGEIVVALKERTPAALWQYRKKITLIDADGVVLADSNLSTWRHLPLVVGEDAPRHVRELKGWLAAEPVVAEAMVSATRIGGRRWDLRLQNGLLVRLPEKDVELALRTLARLEEEKSIFSRGVKSIDLRQPDRLVMTPASEQKNKTNG